MRTAAMALTGEDALLLAAARTGDRSAFEQLVRRHARAAARIASRLLESREDAEDVVQDAFTNAFLALASFRGHASFKTWILHITFNLAQDQIRQRARRERTFGRGGHDGAALPCPAAGPARHAAARDDAEHLQRVLEELPPRQKAALLLKVYEGLAYAEVAAVLGTTPGAARVYVSLARQSLRRRCEHLLGEGP